MAFVIKVEYEGILRRFPFNTEDRTGNVSFAKLEGRVRDLLTLPSSAQLKITYQDKENDDVTLSNDSELKDACIIQKLNPLRLKVVMLPSMGGKDVTGADAAQAENSSAQISESVENPTIPETYVKKIVECYAPVFAGICPPSRIPEVMDDIVKKVLAQVSAVAVTQSVQPTDNVNPATETSQLTPLDWLRNLPTELEKQAKTTVEGPTETSPVNSSAKGTEEVVHGGVTCDMCHMSPITGIRYKAIKKMNYDLCGRCFDKAGRADDYNRIEQPLSRPMWGTNAVRMMRLTPALVKGTTDQRSSAKHVKAADVRRRPMKTC